MSFLTRKTLCCFYFPSCVCLFVCFHFPAWWSRDRAVPGAPPLPASTHAVRSLLQGIVPASACGKACLPSGQHSRGSPPAPKAWGTAGLPGREGGTGGSWSSCLKHAAAGCTQVKGMKQGWEEAQTSAAWWVQWGQEQNKSQAAVISIHIGLLCFKTWNTTGVRPQSVSLPFSIPELFLRSF